MIYHYADVMPGGRVRACFSYEGPDEGPPAPDWESQAEGQVVLLAEPIDWGGPSETSVLYWRDGTLSWVETAPLTDLVAVGVERIDRDADAARLQVVGDPTKIAEYQRAESQARQYKAAGYAGDPPSCVACWASAKEWSGQQAADDIIATADQWYALLDAIRGLRLHAKEDVRRAVDGAEVAARVAQFAADLMNLMKGIS